ncbi:MAG: M48 family metallopeptidase [Phycisphaerae bacterium]
MQIVVLAAFALTLTAAELARKAPLAEPTWALAAAVAIYLLLAATLAALSARIVVNGSAGLAEPPPKVLARRNLLGILTSLVLVAGSALLMTLGLAKWLSPLLAWPLASEAAEMAPFTAGLLIVWLLEYPAYAVLRLAALRRQAAEGKSFGRLWSRREYIAYNTRHYILFIAAPAGLILLTHDVIGLYVGPLLGEGRAGQYVLQGLMTLAGAGAFVIAPTLIVHTWRTGPLGQGPLKDGLEAIGRRIGFRARGIRVWLTGGAIANAAVMGLLAPVRYVLLSDALLEQMEDKHIEAVFAHEAGHVVSHHIFYSVVFGAASVMLCWAATGGLIAATAVAEQGRWPIGWMSPDTAGEILFLALLTATWALGFGWISRRFERQSDVIAAWAMGQESRKLGVGSGELGVGSGELGVGSGVSIAEAESPGERRDPHPTPYSPHPTSIAPPAAINSPDPTSSDDHITQQGAALFARALERVAELNGIPYRHRNWRHGAVAWRVEYIIWLGSTGGSRRDIDLVVRRIKVGLWVALAAGVAVMVAMIAMGGS